MFIPVGGSFVQNIMLVKRTKDTGPVEDAFEAEELMPVRYVPLVKTPPRSDSPISERKKGERHEHL
jgi:protein-L-isoaspartate O-methyltransferase